MPKILEIKEIDFAVWVRVGESPPDFPSGVALWTPEEQAENRNNALDEAAKACEDTDGSWLVVDRILALKT